MKQKFLHMGVWILLMGAFALACLGAAGDERFSGGDYDGYARAQATDTSLSVGLPAGTLIMVR